MIDWLLRTPQGIKQEILCLGAHCDDIEIGCGGTLLRLGETQPQTHVHCVIFSSSPIRKKETLKALGTILKGFEQTTIEILEFRNSYFPYVAQEIKEYFESLKTKIDPNLILSHFRDDRHQDHRLISDLTWNSFRDHMILEYEIPKYDGDIGQPNTYIEIPEPEVVKKTACIIDCFPSQKNHDWFTEETFRALMRLRGIECNARSGYAEAYHCRKIKFGF